MQIVDELPLARFAEDLLLVGREQNLDGPLLAGTPQKRYSAMYSTDALDFLRSARPRRPSWRSRLPSRSSSRVPAVHGAVPRFARTQIAAEFGQHEAEQPRLEVAELLRFSLPLAEQIALLHPGVLIV